MSVKEIPLPPHSRTPRHSVAFYASDSFPVWNFAEHLAEGLSLGEGAFTALRKEHLDPVLACLETFNFDVHALRMGGLLLCVDPEATLRELQGGGGIKQASVAPFFLGELDKLIKTSAARKVRAIGEVAPLLLEDGKPEDALELEQCWNRIAASYPIRATCAYRESAFAQKNARDQFCALCDEHDAVIPNLTASGALDKAPEWFTLLQVQTSSLRREVFKHTGVERQMRKSESERLHLLESCLRKYKTDIEASGFQEILSIIYELCWDAYTERLELSPESPEWYKLTGEILSYSRLVVRLDIWNKHQKTN